MAFQTVTAAHGSVAPSSSDRCDGNFHHAILLQYGVIGEHAVDAAAKGAGVDVRRRLAAGPALKEVAGDAIAGFHPGNAGPDLDHFSGAV